MIRAEQQALIQEVNLNDAVIFSKYSQANQQLLSIRQLELDFYVNVFSKYVFNSFYGYFL